MSTKLINKKDLTYKSGYLTDNKGNVVDTQCLGSFNILERMYQEALHTLTAKEKMVKPIVVEPFEFKSEHDTAVVIKEPKTPALDKRAAEALEFLKETNITENYKRATFVSDRFKNINEFVNNDTVCVVDNGIATRGDLRFIGNPLNLTKAKLVKIYETIAEADGE